MDQQYSTDRYGAGIVDAPAAVKKARSQGGGLALGLGLLMAGAVAASARRRGLGVKLGWTYLGGLAAFAGPAATPEQAAISLAVGMVLMPVTSALFYEMSSHGQSRRFEAIASGIAVAPIVDARGISGVRAGLSFGF